MTGALRIGGTPVRRPGLVIPELALIKVLKVWPICFRFPGTNREGTSWWDCPILLISLYASQNL